MNDLPKLEEGQVRILCPLCDEQIIVRAEHPTMPIHTFEERVRSSSGRGQVELPLSIEIRCLASEGRIKWRWLG